MEKLYQEQGHRTPRCARPATRCTIPASGRRGLLRDREQSLFRPGGVAHFSLGGARLSLAVPCSVWGLVPQPGTHLGSELVVPTTRQPRRPWSQLLSRPLLGRATRPPRGHWQRHTRLSMWLAAVDTGSESTAAFRSWQTASALTSGPEAHGAPSCRSPSERAAPSQALHSSCSGGRGRADHGHRASVNSGCLPVPGSLSTAPCQDRHCSPRNPNTQGASTSHSG